MSRTHIIPNSCTTVSVVSLSHCLEESEVPDLVLHLTIKPRMVTALQETVTHREKIPRAAKVVANTFPSTSPSPVLMKHQVPGHWRVYFPTPMMGRRAKSNTRSHTTARVCFVTLVFM